MIGAALFFLLKPMPRVMFFGANGLTWAVVAWYNAARRRSCPGDRRFFRAAIKRAFYWIGDECESSQD